MFFHSLLGEWDVSMGHAENSPINLARLLFSNPGNIDRAFFLTGKNEKKNYFLWKVTRILNTLSFSCVIFTFIL